MQHIKNITKITKRVNRKRKQTFKTHSTNRQIHSLFRKKEYEPIQLEKKEERRKETKSDENYIQGPYYAVKKPNNMSQERLEREIKLVGREQALEVFPYPHDDRFDAYRKYETESASIIELEHLSRILKSMNQKYDPKPLYWVDGSVKIKRYPCSDFSTGLSQLAKWNELDEKFRGNTLEQFEEAFLEERTHMEKMKMTLIMCAQFKDSVSKEKYQEWIDQLKELVEQQDTPLHEEIWIDVQLISEIYHTTCLVEIMEVVKGFYEAYPRNKSQSLVGVLQPLPTFDKAHQNMLLHKFEELMQWGITSNNFSPVTKVGFFEIWKYMTRALNDPYKTKSAALAQYDTAKLNSHKLYSISEGYRAILTNFYANYKPGSQMNYLDWIVFNSDMGYILSSSGSCDAESLFLLAIANYQNEEYEAAETFAKEGIQEYFKQDEIFGSDFISTERFSLGKYLEILGNVCRTKERYVEASTYFRAAAFYSPLDDGFSYFLAANNSRSLSETLQWLVLGLGNHPDDNQLEILISKFLERYKDRFDPEISIDRLLKEYQDQDCLLEVAKGLIVTNRGYEALNAIDKIEKQRYQLVHPDHLLSVKLSAVNMRQDRNDKEFSLELDLEDILAFAFRYQDDPEMLLKIMQYLYHEGHENDYHRMSPIITSMVTEKSHIKSDVYRLFLKKEKESGFGNALDHLNQMLNRFPDAVHIYHTRALFLERQGKLTECFEDLSKAFFYTGHPDFSSTTIQLAFKYGDKQKTLDWIQRTLAVDPSDYHCFFFLAYYCVEEGNFDKAADYIREALLRNPFLTSAYPRIQTRTLARIEAHDPDVIHDLKYKATNYPLYLNPYERHSLKDSFTQSSYHFGFDLSNPPHLVDAPVLPWNPKGVIPPYF